MQFVYPDGDLVMQRSVRIFFLAEPLRTPDECRRSVMGKLDFMVLPVLSSNTHAFPQGGPAFEAIYLTDFNMVCTNHAL